MIWHESISNFVVYSRRGFGLVVGGEFAGSPNDCGLFLLGVQGTATSPQCGEYNDWEHYNDTMREGVQNFIIASFDALGDWFFWTWKVRYCGQVFKGANFGFLL